MTALVEELKTKVCPSQVLSSVYLIFRLGPSCKAVGLRLWRGTRARGSCWQGWFTETSNYIMLVDSQ